MNGKSRKKLYRIKTVLTDAPHTDPRVFYPVFLAFAALWASAHIHESIKLLSVGIAGTMLVAIVDDLVGRRKRREVIEDV